MGTKSGSGFEVPNCDTDSSLQIFAPHFQDQKTSPPSGPCF